MFDIAAVVTSNSDLSPYRMTSPIKCQSAKNLIHINDSSDDWEHRSVPCSRIFWSDQEGCLLINCDYWKPFDPFSVWHAIPEPPSAARHLIEPLDQFWWHLVVRRRYD